MASNVNFGVGIDKDTRFLYSTDYQENAPCRLYEKEDKSTGKSYYEGCIKLTNGQFIWVSTGGKLKEGETSKGKKYITVNVKLTSKESKKGGSNKRYDS